MHLHFKITLPAIPIISCVAHNITVVHTHTHNWISLAINFCNYINISQSVQSIGVMYRKRRPDVISESASNATINSTPTQSVSPLLSSRPTYGSVSSIDEPPPNQPARSQNRTQQHSIDGNVDARYQGFVETYRPISNE